MPELITAIIIFVMSLTVLIKASDFFTGSAEKVGRSLRLPSFIVGVTIVAVGTSLPELISSIFAVLRNSSEIVVGNVIGSNIANIFLILGVIAIFGRKINIAYELIHVDLPILIGSAFLFGVMIFDGFFTLPEALLSIAGIILYFRYASKTGAKDVEIKKEMKKEHKGRNHIIEAWFILIISTVFIYIGAKYTIESIIQLSDILNIGKEVIAISAVALGTSLPELAVSITAARKGEPEMAVGNILGSNIFNTFAVMGIPALIGTLIIPRNIIVFGLPVMLIATMLYFFMTQDRKVTKWEGYLLLMFYLLFISKVTGLF
jgi:cation:H+ antiporter